jgi:ATP-dependent exoDNAse (exonuclease V) alpha subunit
MNKVLQAAESLRARVVLAGDTRQHSSVERGDAMRLLESHGGMKPSILAQIRRQTADWYREAVGLVADGQHRNGFDSLLEKGAVVEIADKDTRHKAIVTDYMQALKDKKSVLAVAPTNSEARAVTGAIRDALKSRKFLSTIERTFTTQTDLKLTEAQKADPASYEVGQVVQFSQNAKGIKRGSRLTVCGHDEKGQVLAADKHGHQKVLPLDFFDRFAVYRTQEIQLAKGDAIRFTQNGFTKDKLRVTNGDLARIAGFTPEGDIVLNNKKGSVVPKDYSNFSHGYVITSYASQGKTVDRVLIAQAGESLPASSAEQFYVSISRGRESVRVYTDDAESLARAVGKSGQRLAAVELVSEKNNATHERASVLQRLKTHTRCLATRASEKVMSLTPRKPRKERGHEPVFG